MFSSLRAVWYLPFFLVVAVYLLSVSYNATRVTSYHNQDSQDLTAILSPQTVSALNKDAQLHNVLLSLAGKVAEVSTDYGERFHIGEVKDFGVRLADDIALWRTAQQKALQKRGLIDDLGSAFQQFVGGGKGAPGGFNLTAGFNGILDRIGDKITGSLATPALFLGIGLGMGASNGLNLTDMASANAQATKVASTYNASATGVNLIAQNLGSGVAGQVVPALGSSNVPLGQAAYALASGIGNATAFGLNLTQEQSQPSNGSDLAALAGNLGLGVTAPIVSKIDFKALMNNIGGGSMLNQQLPKIAAAAGQGLGEGARNGLGLSATPSPRSRKRQQGPKPDELDIPGTVGSFAKGLSESFLTNSNLTKLNLTGGFNGFAISDSQSMLRPLAAGAGAGVGMGIAVGLDFKSKDATPTFGGNITGKDEQTALIAESLVQNVLSNLLLNSTTLRKAGDFIASNQPQAVKSISGAKAAEGFARGAIEGIVSAMSSVGGLKNLISGDVPPNAIENVPVLEPSKFDDSTNGTAIGFARGLTGPGTILVAEVIRNLTGASKNTTGSPGPKKRNIGSETDEPNSVPYNSLVIRQNNPTLPGPAFPAIDASTIQLGTQKVVDFLTCQGIGGLSAAAQGAMSKNSMMKNMGQSGSLLDPRVLQALPSTPINLTSENNNFQIILRDVTVEVNGIPFRKFVSITAVHVAFASLGFMLFLPLYLIFGVVWRFSVLAGHPINESKNRKWRLGFLVAFLVFSFIGIVVGIAGMGSARHFREVHGVFGLLSLLFLFPTVGVSIVRLRTTIPHPLPASFAGIKGPISLAKSPQRLYLISGILIQATLLFGQLAFVQGFSLLRSISLCLVDAVLTSDAVANLMSIALMIQISAVALTVFRMWLEQHIARRESIYPSTTDGGEKARQSSIQTFGFDRKTPPPPLNLKSAAKKPAVTQNETNELQGFADVAISTPYNVRKEGSIISPVSPVSRTYNPKIGGYDQSPGIPHKAGIAESFAGPKTVNVSTRDLFPPPPPAKDDEVDGRMYLTAKSATSNYSKPSLNRFTNQSMLGTGKIDVGDFGARR